jgi:ribosomal protein L29
MDIKIVTAEEMRAYEPARLVELEGELRSELLKIRMDVYQSPTGALGKARTIKRNLARVLTVSAEKKTKTTSKK